MKFSCIHSSTKLEAKNQQKRKKSNFLEFIFLLNWKQKSAIHKTKDIFLEFIYLPNWKQKSTLEQKKEIFLNLFFYQIGSKN